MTEKINLATAAPLSLWKTLDGRKAVFGCYMPENTEYCCVGFVGEEAVAWRKNGTNYLDSYTIVAPWPKEPVVFEVTVFSIPFGNGPEWQSVLFGAPHIGGVHDDNLTPFIGKRVEITVRELP